jgi:hypothetical protein
MNYSPDENAIKLISGNIPLNVGSVLELDDLLAVDLEGDGVEAGLGDEAAPAVHAVEPLGPLEQEVRHRRPVLRLLDEDRSSVVSLSLEGFTKDRIQLKT